MKVSIKIPENVEVVVEGKKVIVSGPKRKLERDFNDPRFNKKITITKENSEISILSDYEKRQIKAILGTIKAHIKNMILGVTKGFEYKMKICYTHFPMAIEQKGNEVLIRNFLGSKGYRRAKIMGDTKLKIEKEEIIVTGINKEHVAQTCANIENACRVTKRDRRVFMDGIYLVKEHGK